MAAQKHRNDSSRLCGGVGRTPHLLIAAVLFAPVVACGDRQTAADCGCAPGELCVDAVCRRLCNSDSTCDAGSKCVAGVCMIASTGCGDGVLREGEECDDGDSNSDVLPDACRTSCRWPRCGDGVVDAGEACDTGLHNSDARADACRATCERARCGDGVVDTGEACDDAGESNRCDADCTAAACGDGSLNAAAGEGCDDAGVASGDGCSDACRVEPNSSCAGTPSVCTVDGEADPFSFAARTDLEPGAAVESEEITVDGFLGTLALRVGGSAAAEILLNDAATGAAEVEVDAGDRIRIRVTAPSSYDTTVGVPVSLGGYATEWSLSTAHYVFRLALTLRADVSSFNLHAALRNAGWDGVADLAVTVDILAAVRVTAAGPGVAAFDVGSPYPPNSAIAIRNAGIVLGAQRSGTSDSFGGQALVVGDGNVLFSLHNTGVIGGGGGAVTCWGAGNRGAAAIDLADFATAELQNDGVIAGGGGGGASGDSGGTTCGGYSGFCGGAGGPGMYVRGVAITNLSTGDLTVHTAGELWRGGRGANSGRTSSAGWGAAAHGRLSETEGLMANRGGDGCNSLGRGQTGGTGGIGDDGLSSPVRVW